MKFNYPADFIAEGLDQTRGWFYNLHVIGNSIMNENAFKNVIVNGLILAEDGKKMSKKLKNYPDPKYLLDKYGADSFRLYVLSSSVVKAEPLRFSEKGVEQIYQDVILALKNIYNFIITYAKVDNFKHNGLQIYFIRHAKKSGDSFDSPLLNEGLKQLEEKEFIEKIIRIDPDILIVSPALRTKQTAEGILKIKKAEYIEDETLWNNTFDYDKLKSYEGKNILIVGHVFNFEKIWYNLFGVYKKIDTLEVVKLPLYPVLNELDVWLYSEFYNLLNKVDKALKNYEIDIAAKNLINFIDKITNWYIRRSRRRFWEEGLSNDKLSAYYTLIEVFIDYLKLLAPFAPFITEWIYLKLGEIVKLKYKSIHLNYWPIFSNVYINEQLIKEIELVRKIIRLGLYIRAKNKIKVRQPLKKLWIGI